MKKRIYPFFIFAILSATLSMFGADPEVRALSEALEGVSFESPIATRLRSAFRKKEDVSDENIPNEAHEAPIAQLFLSKRRDEGIAFINAEPAGGFVTILSPYLSDTGIIKALIEAHEKGVKVKAQVGCRAKGLEKLQKAGIDVTIVPGLHAKMIITSSGTIMGSDNFSSFSATRPLEVMIRSNDPSGASQLLEPISGSSRIVPIPGPTPKKATPKREKFSRGHNGFKADRFIRFVTEPDAANSLDIFSMTFDSDRIVSTIEEVYDTVTRDSSPRVRFFLDSSALKHTDLLERMQKAGGDRLEIYIFNADKSQKVFGNIPQIMHQKVLIRVLHEGSDREEKYVIISTGNLTNQSHREFNVDSHHPNDSASYDTLKRSADEYAKSSDWTKFIPESK